MEKEDDKTDDIGMQESAVSSTDQVATSLADPPFGAIQREYETAVTELSRTDGLEKYARAFTNVYEFFNKTYANEKLLALKCQELESNLESCTEKCSVAMAQVEENRDIIAKLKQDLEWSRKLTDAAHVREQNAQEAIENLRQQVSRLKQEIEKKKEMAGEQADESGPAAKSKEGLMKEREKLLNDLSVIKERLANTLNYQAELEKEMSAADARISELTQEVEGHVSEASKQQRIRDRMEQDLKDMKAEVETKEKENSALSLNLKQTQNREEKLQITLCEEKIKVENLTKQVESLNSQLQKTTLDYEHQQILSAKLTAENLEKTTEIKTKEDELTKVRNELSKAYKLQDSYLKKAQHMDQLRGYAEQKKVKAMETLALVQRDMEAARKQAIQDKRTIENVTRQKEILKNNLLKQSNTVAEQNKILQIGEQARRGLELKLGQAMNEAAKQANNIADLEHERDRHIAEGIELTRKMQETMEDVQFKQMTIIDQKKQLADAEIKFSKQQDMIEALRSDRNSLSKTLQQSKDEISELKQKLEVMTREVEQLKECVSSAEAQLRKEQSALLKVQKEREALRAELQQTRETLSASRQEVVALNQEVRRLQQTIHEGEMERRRLQKDMDKILNERDILGTQLVRRNDERLILHEKIKLLEGTVTKGDAEYEQRMEDIKLLELEVQTLRQEKTQMTTKVNNMSDLRQEILHLERNLTHEKLKCRALEEELQNPLNVHRWRRLEGADPEKFDLMQKVRHLQRRVLNMSKMATDRETQMKEMERRYKELVEKTEKQCKPAQELADKLTQVKHTLEKKTQSVKCLEAEVIMYKAEAKEYKHKLELTKEEVNEFKKLYYELKQKEMKRKEQMAYEKKTGFHMKGGVTQTQVVSEVTETITVLPHVINNQTRGKPRIIGGGFSMDSHTRRQTC
ncbi:cilia- and flagella-associated protein 58-like isoform X1 [Schistocerca gregaria]|uniref:cilia- and flagella-associated protein 58-like isoform X1 n=1 Tax=Schistocerca gregaria TaxID=7010 RepID=UPI00211EB90D|nr:cilia- and flagella-associated protein 58-like isoform X1 [Schistocerca gregaria]XP_049851597.1 cilia- and flagella-associated protein 58-like isoform X1 [Schistocerca gregaria]